MSNELIISDMAELERMGAVFVKSGFFADTRDAAQAIVKIMAGRELGIAPIAAMTGIHIISGRPALGANLIATKIKASGKYDYFVKQNSATVCEIEFFQHGEPIGNSVFTIDDARKAGTKNLDKYPRNMLFARALSNGAKWYCPDAFAGIAAYVPEELGANVSDDGEPIVVTIEQPTQTAPEPQPQPPAPMQWTRDPAEWEQFRTTAKSLGLEGAEIKRIFNVQSFHELTLSRADAEKVLRDHVEMIKKDHLDVGFTGKGVAIPSAAIN